jgi:hypothetical protein
MACFPLTLSKAHSSIFNYLKRFPRVILVYDHKNEAEFRQAPKLKELGKVFLDFCDFIQCISELEIQ